MQKTWVCPDDCDCILRHILNGKKNDITIVDGNEKDHMVTDAVRLSDETRKMDRSIRVFPKITKRVWQASAPCLFDVDTLKPIVSARKAQVMRDYLNGTNQKGAEGPKKVKTAKHPLCNSPEHPPHTQNQKVLRFDLDEPGCEIDCPGNINVSVRLSK